MYSVFCTTCRAPVREKHSPRPVCPDCGGPLAFRYEQEAFAVLSSAAVRDSTMWRYRDLLPVDAGSAVVTLGEGGTPLQGARIYPEFGLHYKNESMNPTGSIKDRAISVAMTNAVECGARTVMLYSDGSTALASAAYAARAGLRHITVVAPGTPDANLLPLAFFGSLILEYQGSRADALDWAHRASRELGFCETTTYRRANPYQAEGPRTIAFEIFEQLGAAPAWVIVPVGGGGTLTGIWRGFCQLQACGKTSTTPRMAGVLPCGYTMLAEALELGAETDEELRRLAPACPPPTIQVKTAMAFSPDGVEAIGAVRASGGRFLCSTDEEALAAQRRLASSEGIYAEPSAAVALTGAEQLIRTGAVRPGETLVAVVTGSGFRETAQLAGVVGVNRIPIEPAAPTSRVNDLFCGIPDRR